MYWLVNMLYTIKSFKNIHKPFVCKTTCIQKNYIKVSKNYNPSTSTREFLQISRKFFISCISVVIIIVVDHSPCPVPSLKEFLPVTSDELKIIVNRSPPTNCDLDPVPTRLLKEQLDCIIPLMVNIVNKSMCSGVFPDCLKQTIVVPLLKKKSLDKNVYSNYRPVSNLAFLSKVIERVVAQRLNSHMDFNNMHEAMQSAYKNHHSTETALLYI